MPSNEEDAGELLWKYIEELKQTDAPESVHFVVRSSVDPADVAGLLPVADAVRDALQTEDVSEAGRLAARAQLIEAIRGPRPAEPTPKAKPARKWFFWPEHPQRRQLALAVALWIIALAAIAYTLMSAYQRYCTAEQPQSRQSVSGVYSSCLSPAQERLSSLSLPMLSTEATLPDPQPLRSERCR